MKKFTSPTIFFGMLCLLLVYSCKKQIGDIFSDPSKPEGLQWAKEYYAQHLQQQNSFSVKLSGSKGTLTTTDLKNNKKTPVWTKASEGITFQYTFAEIPLRYAHKITPTLALSKNPDERPVANPEVIDASFDRLIIYKDKNGKIGQRIISYIPDEAYLKKHKGNISHNRINQMDKDFFGYVHYKDWEGKALFAIRVENGKAVKRYNLANNVKRGISNLAQSAKPSGSKVMVLPVDPPDCIYLVTWDWYQDCYYASEEATTPTYCDPVVIYNVESILISCNEPSGGGSGDGGSSDPGCPGLIMFETGECVVEEPEVTLDSLIKQFCDNLTADQKAIINTSVTALKTFNCATKYIYEKFKTENRSFKFCISAQDGNASYGFTKGFNFGSDLAAAQMNIVEHEFYHAFQQTVYPGGIEQYGRPENAPPNTLPNAGFVNTEFEQMVMNDMINGNYLAFTNGTPSQKDLYEDWVKAVTNNYSTYPKLKPEGTPTEVAEYNNFMTSYNSFLAAFNALPNNPYHSTALNMQPYAIVNLFNHINRTCP
ncbi:hypothetical protein [Pedobacter insulae]|uniref:Uncharacterized protein n=1 Tax=Pedobacter insulae TaxID=414048 RepID=A0A1I2ZCH8_9SPHI|nr:hypothetical protein [Pedobacter insulae]SFH35259.1 hypothetical protein SAMN04489864_109140 [Pedobacter insulae]